jgi:hypothetical protein
VDEIGDYVKVHDHIQNNKWKELYNRYNHYRLQNNIIGKLLKNEEEQNQQQHDN